MIILLLEMARSSEYPIHDILFLHTTKKKRDVRISLSSRSYPDAPRIDRTNPTSYFGYGRTITITTTATTRIVDCMINPPFEQLPCVRAAALRSSSCRAFEQPPCVRAHGAFAVAYHTTWKLLYSIFKFISILHKLVQFICSIVPCGGIPHTDCCPLPFGTSAFPRAC